MNRGKLVFHVPTAIESVTVGNGQFSKCLSTLGAFCHTENQHIFKGDSVRQCPGDFVARVVSCIRQQETVFCSLILIENRRLALYGRKAYAQAYRLHYCCHRRFVTGAVVEWSLGAKRLSVAYIRSQNSDNMILIDFSPSNRHVGSAADNADLYTCQLKHLRYYR